MAQLITGKIYKLVNTVSQNCLNVVEGSSNGASVSSTKWQSLSNQFWKVIEKSQGVYQFVIDNQPTPNVSYVLDASQTALGELCVYADRGSANQLWTIEPIKPNAFLCYIKTNADERVLQFDAENKKVYIAPKDASKLTQFWTFEEQ